MCAGIGAAGAGELSGGARTAARFRTAENRGSRQRRRGHISGLNAAEARSVVPRLLRLFRSAAGHQAD